MYFILMNKLFFELIRVSIGEEACLSHTPKAAEWKELYSIAKQQSLVGICFAGLQKLQRQCQCPPEALYLRWMGMAAKIQQQGEKHREVIGRVCELLTTKGIDAIFMKGLVCAERYVVRGAASDTDNFSNHSTLTTNLSLLRQCGDIDFVVCEEDFAKTLDALEEVAEVDRSLVHEHHGMAHMDPSTGPGQDSVQLEPHYKIHNYQNPWNDRMMRRLQKEVMDAPKCYVEIGGKKIRKFPMEFEGMFLVSHMVNHVYEEGLGLRQVIDFAFWINALKVRGERLEVRDEGLEVRGFDMELYHEYLRKMNMTRAARIFTCICEKYLGVDRFIMGYAYTEKEEAFADKMVADITAVGNFAKDVKLEAGLHAYIWTTKRAFTLGYLCPSEARWWPLSKFARFFWKKLK